MKKESMMSENELLSQVADTVVEGDKEKAKAAAQAALDAGVPPVKIVQVGVGQGMTRIGKRFQEFEVFLPELMLAAEAGKACLDLVSPHLGEADKEQASQGKIVIGTVTGDIHDIGKNLVAAILSSSGFDVYDLGVDVTPLDFVKKAEEVDARIIGMSSLMTTSLPYQRDVMDYLRDSGLREKYYVIVGGGPVTPEWAKEVGADGYARLATGAVEVCQQLVGMGVKPPLDNPVIVGAQEKD
jgi:corrinoid protein of di/trimethylamine methyltransferase